MSIPRSLKWTCAALWTLAIPALSLLPPRFFRTLARSTPGVPGADKIVHGVMYAILTALVLWALTHPGRRPGLRAAWRVVVLATLYGAVMELLQARSHAALHRVGEPWDALANAAGAVLAAVVWLLCQPQRLAHVGRKRQVEGQGPA